MKWNNSSLFSISRSSLFLLCLICSVFNHAQAEVVKESTNIKNSTLESESRTSLLPAFNTLAENFEFDEIENCLPEFIQHYVLNKPAKKVFEDFLKVLEDEPQVDKVLKYLSLSSHSKARKGVLKSMKEVSLHLHLELDRLFVQFFDSTKEWDSSGLHKVAWKILSFVSFQDFRQDVLYLVERDVGFSNFLSFLNNEDMADAYYRIKSSPQAQKLVTILHLQDGFSFDLHYDILGFFEELIGWDSYKEDLNHVEETHKDRVATPPELPVESESASESASQDGGDDILNKLNKLTAEPSVFDKLAFDDEMAMVINRVKTLYRAKLSKMAGDLIEGLGLDKETVQENIASWTDIFLHKIIFDGPILTWMAKLDLLSGIEEPEKVPLGQEKEDDETEAYDNSTEKPLWMAIFNFLHSEVGLSLALKEMKEMLLDELIQLRVNGKVLVRLVQIVVEFHKYIGTTFPWSDLLADENDPRELSELLPLIDSLEKQYQLREEFYQLAIQNPDRFDSVVTSSGRSIELGVRYHRDLFMNELRAVGREYLAHRHSKLTIKENIRFNEGLDKLLNIVDGMSEEMDRDDKVKKFRKKK